MYSIKNEVICLVYKLHLKTSFYEIELFDFLIFQRKLVLSHSRSRGQVITIPEDDILNIILTNGKLLKIEIQTCEHSYQGIFGYNDDHEGIREQLQANIHKKIVYENCGEY